MTDQGRGYGAAPWGHGDPNQGLPYGAGPAGGPQPAGWGDPQAQDPYSSGQYPVHPGAGYPQQPHPQQPYPQQGHPQQPYPQQPHPQQGPQPDPQQGPPRQPYPQQGPPQQPYPPQPYPQQGQPPHGQPPHGQPQQPYPQQPRPQQPQQRPPGPAQPPAAPALPAGPAVGADGIDWEAEAAALEGDSEEEYEQPDAVEAVHGDAGTDEEPVYDDEEGYQPFLSAEDDSRSGERRRKQQGRSERKRSGVACLGISMLMIAVVAGGGYFGYGFYKQHFGPPADYAGGGTGSVTVTIANGALGTDMAVTLQTDGVVESSKAFVNAYNKNPKAASIQPGSYTLKLRMSAASAVTELVAANGGDALIIPEGLPASQIYPKIDAKLGLPAGTTAGVAKADVAALGLPAYAKGDIEGFLWPTRYSIAKGMKPEDLLKQMVANTVAQFDVLGMDSGAAGVKLQSGYEVLIEASILQAEGNNSEDFSKIARVLSNRLNTTDTQGELQLDTTLQYYLRSKTFTNKQKETITSGYNTYVNKGLPPGPISNPGAAAIQAVLAPAPGDWAYFIAMSPSDTRFATTFAQFKVYVQEYCTDHHQGFDAVAGQCD